jgi:hypothetical protein
MAHLKKKWNIESNWDLTMILLVFTLAGTSITFMRKPIFHLLGIESDTALWIKVAVYIPLIFPLYQLNLIIYGTLLGQFRFFWEKEKQMLRVFKRLFTGRQTRPAASRR